MDSSKDNAPAATFARAEEFIWRNARLLDRRRFAYHFKGGPRDAVLGALAAYQNPDGGFGNALEPDKRCPDSQPVDVQVALDIMDDVGFDDAIARRVCDFLESISTPEGGVPFALPSVNGYPRAGWWNADDDPPASLNPTAAIAGLLLKNRVDHAWVGRAAEFCWRGIAAMQVEEVHELLCVLAFLEHAPDRQRAEAEFATIGEQILAKGLVELDPNAGGYVQPPLVWAPAPDRMARRLFSDDLIDVHLDALMARQQKDGGWPISWPPISPACELEWRGSLTVTALKTLRAYGRL